MIGTTLRVRYELTEQLSQSILFKSFVATDKLENRDVCVWLLQPEYASNEDLVETLGQVVKRVSTVRSPHIEDLYELDSDEQAVFVVGQLTRGHSLADRLRKLATFSAPAAIEVGIAMCEGLQTLHQSAIAHGDVTSSTVISAASGEIRLQLPGLWEAYFADPAARNTFLTANAAYLSPEVTRGALPSPASDVYAVGVILFELLTGRQPFRGDTSMAMAIQHATEPVPSPRAMIPTIPQALDGIVRKALAKEVSARYRDGGELLSDLRMLRDAMRFGKSMAWPTETEPPADAGPGPATAAVVPKVAAPVKKRGGANSDEGDVPVWLRIAIAFVAGLVFVMVVVFFFMNADQPKSIKVPQLAQLSEKEAVSALVRAGLKLGRERNQPSERIAPGQVISSTPTAGQTVRQNGQIDLLVSSGSKFIEVPDLRGVTVDKARDTLSGIGLVLDEDRMEQVSDRSLEAGLIVSQTPPPHGKYERGTKVRVRVSSGRVAASTNRDANTKYLYHIKVTLSDVDQPVLLRVDLTDARGTKTLGEAEHSPNDEVEFSAEGYGSEVTFRIFYNGELVKQVPASANDNPTSGTD